MFAHQMTSSAMSIGQMNSPYSRPWLCPVSRPIDPEQEHQVPGPGAPDAEPLAPHPARADEAREHVEERAEVHHREPREDHAVHVRRPDAAEREPRDAAERLRRDELRREHEPEQVDDRQPDDRGEEPVLRGAVRERERPAPAPPGVGRLEDGGRCGVQRSRHRRRDATAARGAVSRQMTKCVIAAVISQVIRV